MTNSLETAISIWLFSRDVSFWSESSDLRMCLSEEGSVRNFIILCLVSSLRNECLLSSSRLIVDLD